MLGGALQITSKVLQLYSQVGIAVEALRSHSATCRSSRLPEVHLAGLVRILKIYTKIQHVGLQEGEITVYPRVGMFMGI